MDFHCAALRYSVCDSFGWAGRYYGPDFQLHIQPSNMENLNTQEYLERSVVPVVQSLVGITVR